MRFSLLFALLVAWTTPLHAAVRASVAVTPDGPRSFLVDAGGVRLRFTALSPRAFRLHALEPATPAVPELMVVKPEADYPPLPLSCESSEQAATLRAGTLTVTLSAASGTVRVSATSGGLKIGGLELASAAATFSLPLSPGERVYGFGDKRAALDQRGHTVEIVNRDAFASETNASYKSIPFCFASGGWGLFLHDFHPSLVDVGAAHLDRLAWTVPGGALDLYVFLGAPREILDAYTELTGRPALLPRWTFGYHQGKAAYAGRDAYRVAAEMRRRKLPLEAIYYDDFVDEAATPAFVKGLRDRFHVRLTMGGNPFLIGESPFMTLMGRKDQLMVDAEHRPVIEPAEEIANDQGQADVVGYVDFFAPGAADAFVRHAWQDAAAAGVPLGMADFGELDHIKTPEARFWPSLDLPVSATRNLYALAYGRAMIEGCAALAGARPTGMLRPGFAGAQRYGWTTTADSLPTFTNFKAHLRALLNLTLSGYSNVGYDIGGWDSHGPADVYARTFAAATFNPFMWAHGQKDHEPYTYGPAVEDAARAWLGWRYRLLPFLYSLSEEAHRTGLPVQRALPLALPGDPAAARVDDQFFVGDDLLIAPVFDASGGRALYLPSGTWYDLFGGATPITGGGTIARENVPWDAIPAYVRAGAILPLGPAMSWSDERPVDPLTVRYFAAQATSSFVLYEDDGVTHDHERGAFARTALTVARTGAHLTFTARVTSGDGRFQPRRTAYALEAIGVPRPTRVTNRGRPVAFTWDDGRLEVTVPAHPDPLVETE